MEKKDYYAILGVSRTESTAGIRAAFRKLAKVHHPDRSGPESTRCFQEITEAYCILSNPEARKSYNDTLRRQEEGVKKRQETEKRSYPWHRSDRWNVNLDAASRTFRRAGPTLNDLFEELFPDPSAGRFRSQRNPNRFSVEVLLSEDEATHGGVLPVEVPVRHVCRFCDGSGAAGLFRCLRCHGQGSVYSAQALSVRIPSMVRDGTILEIPIGRSKGVDQALIVHIFVRR